MSLPPQANPAAAMAMKSRGTTSGFTTVPKPLTNFSGVVAQHVFSIVQSVSPAKPTEQSNPSIAKALDSLLHIANACGDDALVCAARGIVETEFMREGGMQFSPERGELLHHIIQLFLMEPRSNSFTTNICSTICSRTNFDTKDEARALTTKMLLDFAAQTKLSLETQIAIGVALVQHPVEAIVTVANSFLCILFSDIIKNAKSSDKNKCRFVVFSDANVYHTSLFVMKRDCHLAPFVSLIKYEPPKNVAIPSTLSLLVPNSGMTEMDNSVTVLSAVTPASAMLDAGFGCTSSPAVFKNFLLQVLGTRSLTENDISGMLCVLTKTDSAELRDGMFFDFDAGTVTSSGSSWNVQAFATVIRDLSSSQRLDWVKILTGMDVPSFEQIDAPGFNMITQVYSVCCPKEPFPFIQAYCTQIWKNRMAQLSILRIAVECETDVLPRYGGASDNAPTAANSNERFNMAWGSPHYIDILLRLSNTDVCAQVRRMFEQAWKQNNILLFRSLTNEEHHVTDCQLYRDILAELADTLLVPHNSNGTTLLTLWKECPKGVVDAMRVLYFTDRSKVSTIVEAAHFQSTIKTQTDNYLLKALLDTKPLIFAIDIAVLACQRGILNLEQWLKEKAQQYGSEFIHASLDFLREKYEIKVIPGGIHAKGGANAYILQESVLKMIINLLPAHMSQQDVVLDYKCFINEYNALSKPQQQQPQQSPMDSETQRLTNDSREFIQRIYNGDISPEDAVESLRGQRPLFIRFVGEFFSNFMNLANQEEKVIDVFSQCFGLMVTNGLLGNWAPILLDAFQKDDPALNRFKFNVLTIIQPVLPRSLPLCEQLAHFPAALQKCYPLQKILATETMLMAKNSNVNESAFENASFKINNMTVDTVKEDAAIIRKLFAESKVFPSALFVRNLILPHVSRDEETHELYKTLMVSLNVPDLFDEAAKETVQECLKIIRSNLDDRRTQESLQNLGHWLGHITLGRGKLIPRDLSLKSILILYMNKDKDILHVITSFVTAILSHAAGKPVFMPPNPWMVPLLRLLVQIYDREDVKEYTKFAIEDLFQSEQEDCPSLNLDMNDFRVVPSKEDLLRIFVQERQLNRSRAGQEFYPFVQEFHASFNAIEIVRNCIKSLVLRDLSRVADEVQLRKMAEKTMMFILNSYLQFALSDKIKVLRTKAEYSPELENLLVAYIMDEYTKEAEKELDKILSGPIETRRKFKAMIASGKIPKDTVFQDCQYSDPLNSFTHVSQATAASFYERFAVPEHPVQIAAPENPEVAVSRSADKSGYESIASYFGEMYRLNRTGTKEQRQKVLLQTCEQILSKMKVFGDARYFIDAAVAHAEMACTQDGNVKYGKVVFFVSCLRMMLLYLVQNPDKAAAASERSMILNFALEGFKASLAKRYGNGVAFDQRPYQVLLQMIIDVVYVDKLEFDLAKPPTLHLYHLMCQLNPMNYPGFAFAWLDILGYKRFLPNLLALDADGLSAGEAAKELLMLLLQFMEPYLRAGALDASMEQLYFGSLRLFLILVQEGSELLVKYYNNFCDAIPPNCVQLRNLILSALLPSMKPPTFGTPNMKLDLIPGIRNPPPLPPHCTKALEDGHIISDLEAFLVQGAGPANFENDLMTLLQQPQRTTKYNVPAINALVLQCAIIVTSANGKNNNAFTLFKSLLHAFDVEGRMYLFHAMVNQLRFPNSHMFFYTCLLLKLFQSDLDNTIKDQLVRTVVERFCVRPQPWGVMAFYREMVTDPEFDKFAATLPPETRQFLDGFRKALVS